MEKTLRYGVRGDDVANLQQGLNQMTSVLPRLSLDGIYGSKTVGKVREFQCQHHLVSDGIVGLITWGVFFQILKELGVPSKQPPPSPIKPCDALRPHIINFAERCVGKVDFRQLINSRPKGIDFIKEMFKEAANTELGDANFKKSDGSWTHVPIIDGSPKHWCGIFAVYCYRKEGIKSVRWDLKSGKLVGSIRITQWSRNWVNEIKTADIGCVHTKSHHFLIKAVEAGRSQPQICSIDGNQRFGQILEKNIGDPDCHRVGKDNFNYYALL